MHYNHHYFPFLRDPLLERDTFTGSRELTECWHTCAWTQRYSVMIQPPCKQAKKKFKKSHGSGRAGWSHQQTGAGRAPHSPAPPQVLLKRICLSPPEASGTSAYKHGPFHRRSKDKQVGDKRQISTAETSVRYNWLNLFVFHCRQEDMQDLLVSLHLFLVVFFFFCFLIAHIKCINANGKTFLAISKLCSLELTYAPCFSCHFA